MSSSSTTNISTVQPSQQFIEAYKAGARGIPETVLKNCLPNSERHFGISNLGARVAWWFGQGFDEKPYQEHGAFVNLAAHEVTAQLLLQTFPDEQLVQDYAKTVGHAVKEALGYAKKHAGMALRDMNIRHITDKIDFFGGRCGEMALLDKKSSEELTQLQKINELLKESFKGYVEVRGDRELSFRARMSEDRSAKVQQVVREVLAKRVKAGELDQQFLKEINLFKSLAVMLISWPQLREYMNEQINDVVVDSSGLTVQEVLNVATDKVYEQCKQRFQEADGKAFVFEAVEMLIYLVRDYYCVSGGVQFRVAPELYEGIRQKLCPQIKKEAFPRVVIGNIPMKPVVPVDSNAKTFMAYLRDVNKGISSKRLTALMALIKTDLARKELDAAMQSL